MTLNEESLEKKFQAVSTSQGSIQSLSFFCLHYKNHHKKIAQIWLRCLQKSEVSHRLTLIYLANDIVQNAKRKNTLSFIDDFRGVLKHTIPYLRDEKIRKFVERVFNIWRDRNIFDAKFLSDLKSALNGSGKGATNNESSRTKTSIDTSVTKQHNSSNDLIESLNRIEALEKSVDKIKSSDDNIVDRLAQGPLTEEDLTSNSQLLEHLQAYVAKLKSEIEERNRLSRLLEDSVINQKKLLKESEDQLVMYKSQLDYIMEKRKELG